MRTTFLYVFIFFTIPVFSQQADSLVVAEEVENLLVASDSLFRDGAYRQALAMADAARFAIPDQNRVDPALFERTLNNLGKMQAAMGRYVAAEQSFLDAKAREELHQDSTGEIFSATLSGLGLTRLEMAHYDEAEPLLVKAREIQAVLHGRDSPNYATAVHNVGRLYLLMSRYKEAEQLLNEAKTIREQTIGMNHPDYASSLEVLGSLYFRMGDQAKREHFLQAAFSLREKIQRKEHPEYIRSMLGMALFQVGKDNEQSEKIYREAKSLCEESLGREHPLYALILKGLGYLYLQWSRYEEADTLLKDAINIFHQSLGPLHTEYLRAQLNLGELYNKMGRYEEAEILLAASSAYNAVFESNFSLSQYRLQQLSVLYSNVGAFQEAEKNAREAALLTKNKLGTQNINYAIDLYHLGIVNTYIGDYKKSIHYYLQAIDLLEKLMGKNNIYYTMVIASIGLAKRQLGFYDEAISALNEARAIDEKVSGKENPDDYANAVYELGETYRYQGVYDSAHYFLEEARSIWEGTLGREHPWYSLGLRSLINLFAAQGQYDSAEMYQLEAQMLQRGQLERAARFMSAKQLDAYTHLFEQDLDNDFSIALRRAATSGGHLGLLFDHALFYKGFLLGKASQIKALSISDTASARLYAQLVVVQRQLAAEYSKPPAEREGVITLEAESKTIEKALARTAAGFSNALQQVTWADIQARLSPDMAALEFVRFRFMPPEGPTDSVFYAALLLRPGQAAPEWITLFEEKQLDSLLWRNTERNELYVKYLYSQANRGAKALAHPRKTLYELLWKPLEPMLSGINTIYLAPAGLLHRLNLSAIPINADSTLADRYNLVLLGSTRQLVAPTQTKLAVHDAVLFGDIQYDADSTALPPPATSSLSEEMAAGSRGAVVNSFYQPDSTAVIPWAELQDSKREVTEISRALRGSGRNVTLHLGAAATEEAFKQIGRKEMSPEVLHLATHGFFYPDPVDTLRRSVFSNGEPVFRLSDNPMMRSGLILAGANRVWTGGNATEGMEDGILTAYEISQMNLSNTELVVLSACETGLGDIQGNEGVYGLQRAFKIAGAKYLIMSLWQVPDKQTSLLMTTFYKKWLEGEMEIPEAFRAAQKALRDAGLDPYQWAGFVLVE